MSEPGLGRTVLELTTETQGFVRGLKSAEDAVKQLTAKVDQAQANAHSFGTTFSSVGKSIVGVAGGLLSAQAALSGLHSAFDIIKSGAIGMNASLETTTLQFTTLMGSSQKAQSHVRDLFEIAKKTPFETGPIVEASRKLQTFGGDALNTKANILLLGDAAAATGAPIDELGMWVGRMYASLQAGRPFGESAQRLSELAVMTPQLRMKLEDLQKSGASADVIFKTFTDDLGRFGGAMEAQANTWAGVTSTFKDNVNMLSATAMQPLFETMRDGLGLVNRALGSEGVQSAAEQAGAALQEALGGDSKTAAAGLANLLLDVGDVAITAADTAWGAWHGLILLMTEADAQLHEKLRELMRDVVNASGIIGILVPGTAAAMDVVQEKAQRLQTEYGMESMALTALAEGQRAAMSKWAQGVSKAHQAVSLARTEVQQFATAEDQSAAATEKANKSLHDQAAAAEHAKKKIKDLIDFSSKYSRNINWYIDRETAPNPVFDRPYGGSTDLVDAGDRASQYPDLWGYQPTTTHQNTITRTVDEWASAMSSLERNMGELSQAFSQLSQVTDGAMSDMAKAAAALVSTMNVAIRAGQMTLQGVHQGGAGGSIQAGIGLMSGFAATTAASQGHSRAGNVVGGAATGAAYGAAFGVPGAIVGGLVGGVMGLFGESKGKKEGRAADQQIASIQAELIRTYGSLDNIRKMGGAAGAALAGAWGDKNVAGLQHFQGLVDKFKESLDIQAEIDALNGQLDDLKKSQVPTWDEITAAAERYGIKLDTLGPKIQQLQINEAATSILNDYNTLIAGGAEVNGVLNGMADEISTLVQNSIKFGTEIPENMRPLIETLASSGRLLDANGEKMTDISGLTWGAPVETQADKVAKAMTDLIAKIQKLIDKLNGVPDAVAAIPGTIDIDANVHVHTLPDDRGADDVSSGPRPQYHRGGIVRRAHDGMAIGFGPLRVDEVPIIAQRGEGILSRDVGMPTVAQWALELANRGERMADGGASPAVPEVKISLNIQAMDAQDVKSFMAKTGIPAIVEAVRFNYRGSAERVRAAIAPLVPTAG